MSSAATKSATTGSIPSTVSRSRSNREPITAAALKRALGFRVESVDARGDGGLQRGRHAHLSNLCRRHVCAPLPAQNTALRQFAHDLFGEERVTGGPIRRSCRVALRAKGPARAARKPGLPSPDH